MQNKEKQHIYSRITNQIVSHLEKGVRPWAGRGTPSMQQDGLRASATMASPTAESTFFRCGQAPWHRTSRLPSG